MHVLNSNLHFICQYRHSTKVLMPVSLNTPKRSWKSLFGNYKREKYLEFDNIYTKNERLLMKVRRETNFTLLLKLYLKLQTLQP